MRTFLLCIVVACASAAPSEKAPKRAKRELYSLPDGAEILVGPIKTTFQCPGDGYYADTDNNCQIFHVCHTSEFPNGNVEQQQWSFLCGNQTIFNQYSLTCTMPEESVGCHESQGFFYLNGKVWNDDPKIMLHDEADVQRAAPLIEAMYNSIVGGAAAAAGGGRPRG